VRSESYGHDNTGIKYHWKVRDDGKKAVGIDTGVYAMDQAFEHVDLEQYESASSLSGKYYSRLGAKLTIHRRVSGYVWRLYVPSILAVLASFLPFFLNKNLALPRVLLSSMILIAFLVFFGLVSAHFTPHVGITTSLDVFLLGSLGFIFGGLFLVVYTVHLIDAGLAAGSDLNEKSQIGATNLNLSRISLVDRIGGIFLPIGYLAFNVVYWLLAITLPATMA